MNHGIFYRLAEGQRETKKRHHHHSTSNERPVRSDIGPEMNHWAKHWAETGGLVHHLDKLLCGATLKTTRLSH